MPLFTCSGCGAVENTALGDYWNARREGRPVRCSECATGAWHGRFPKRPGNPDQNSLRSKSHGE